ncbi:MAG: chromosomal replication initiator protein DnaA [Candidatus Marinimicrobia bacterium]|nr:chromosomal replication initiator protein DnaA [Candidatus Neomarinimicrobiota bacterium]
MDLTNIWQDCLSRIKDRIPAQTYQTWFEPLKVTGLVESDIVLQVPSRFYYEWLDSHYRPLILESLKHATGKDLKVRYNVALGDTAQDENETPVPTEIEDPNGFSKSTQLNRRYTFENFIEGAGNQFARAAALSICDTQKKAAFNPLVMYGGVGLGKTHLLQAVGNRMMSQKAGFKIIYTTSEKFTLDFITSIQKNRTTAFSKYFRSVDMLLVDDIQFFQRKEQTQEQFFHTFNDLFQRGKKIVMTMDKPPSELSGLKERLTSRFQSGLTVDIQAPDLETRIAILMRKAEEDKLDIPYDTTEYIARCIKSNVRDLEGALIRLLAYSSLRKQEINLNLARNVVQEILGRQAAKTVTIDEIIKAISRETNIRETLLVGKGRRKDIARARQLAMYLSRELTEASLVSIGLHFAGRDHSTVIHACKKIESMMRDDPVFQAKVDTLSKELANPVY